MSEHINFIAACDGYVYLSIAEDPAAVVAEMRPHCPLPIELVAGWVVPPQHRVAVQRQLSTKLKGRRVGPEWFRFESTQAVSLLEEQAKQVGGKPWRVRKTPVTAPKPRRLPVAARPVITPHGRFESAAEAARVIGVSRAAVSCADRQRLEGLEGLALPQRVTLTLMSRYPHLGGARGPTQMTRHSIAADITITFFASLAAAEKLAEANGGAAEGFVVAAAVGRPGRFVVQVVDTDDGALLGHL